MSIYSFTVKAALAAAVALPLAGGVVLAQTDQSPPEVTNAKYQFAGEVNANNVFVRSGPGDNFYTTMKLNKGDRLTVVGMKFDWLKIVPPAGSFSYVAKVHVDRRGDGTVGRVAKPDLLVKAGSTENTLKYAVQTKLNQGDEVQIIGEEDEYFKIKPPQGAYLYVNKQYVDPVKALKGPGGAADAGPAVTQTPEGNSTAAASEGDHPTTAPTEQANAATQPSGPSASARFDELEAQFLTASKQPLGEQPIDTLLKDYQDLQKASDLPDSMRGITDRRVATLQLRAEAQKELQQAKADWAKNQEKDKAADAERTEIQERLKKNGVTYYTAVGTLRTSSIQDGGQTLYRLTDPNTGATVVYLRGADAKIGSMLGQFLGVKGDVAPAGGGIQILTATEVEAVDPTLVGTRVAARMTPPTLISRTAAGTEK
jgi:uncharacterized protein YgiM (DUF1202 family)